MNAALEFVGSGRVILLVFAVLLVEVAVLSVRRRRTGRGMPDGELLANTLAGGGFAAATGAALVDAGPIAVALCLLLAALGHVLFMVQRLRD